MREHSRSLRCGALVASFTLVSGCGGQAQAPASPAPSTTAEKAPATDGSSSDSAPAAPVPPAQTTTPEAATRTPYAPPPETLASCTKDGMPNVLGSLAPSVFDYVELRRSSGSVGESRIRRGQITDTESILSILRHSDTPPAQRVVLAAGQPCKGAADATTCQEALAGRLELTGDGMTTEDFELVATKDDEILSFTGLASLAKGLQPIDTPEKAALIVLAAGYAFESCDKLPQAKGKDFELTVEIETRPRETGCHDILFSTRVLRVSEDGSVRATSTTKPAPKKNYPRICVDRFGPEAPEFVADKCPEGAICKVLP